MADHMMGAVAVVVNVARGKPRQAYRRQQSEEEHAQLHGETSIRLKCRAGRSAGGPGWGGEAILTWPPDPADSVHTSVNPAPP